MSKRKRKRKIRRNESHITRHSHFYLFAWLGLFILLLSQLVVYGQSATGPTKQQIADLEPTHFEVTYSYISQRPNALENYYEVEFKKTIQIVKTFDKPADKFYATDKYYVKTMTLLQPIEHIIKPKKLDGLLSLERSKDVLVLLYSANKKKTDIVALYDTQKGVISVNSKYKSYLKSNTDLGTFSETSLLFLIIDNEREKFKDKWMKGDQIPIPAYYFTIVDPNEPISLEVSLMGSNTKGMSYMYSTNKIFKTNERYFLRSLPDKKYQYYAVIQHDRDTGEDLQVLELQPKRDISAITYLEARDIFNQVEKISAFTWVKRSDLNNIDKLITEKQIEGMDEFAAVTPYGRNILYARNSKYLNDPKKYKQFKFGIKQDPYKWLPVTSRELPNIKTFRPTQPVKLEFKLAGEHKSIIKPNKITGVGSFTANISIIHDADGNGIISQQLGTNKDQIIRDVVVKYGPNNEPQSKKLQFSTRPHATCEEPPLVEIIWPTAQTEITKKLETPLSRGIEVVAWDDCNDIQSVALYDERAYNAAQQEFAKERAAAVKKAKEEKKDVPKATPMPESRSAIEICKQTCSDNDGDRCTTKCRFDGDSVARGGKLVLGDDKEILFNYPIDEAFSLIVRVTDSKGKSSDHTVRLIMSGSSQEAQNIKIAEKPTS